jgi:hypothetical protein
MGQVLRITVGQADYSVKLLDWNSSELQVELGGQTYQLKRQGLSWVGPEELEPQLSEAIGKSIALRYRI